MNFDFEGLEEANNEEAVETEEEETAEEQGQEEQKPQEPAKPKVDHSIPARQRIEEERDKLKFEATVFGDMQRQASKIIGDMILEEFDMFPEREQEWDYNEWTLVDFLKAFADRARAECSKHGNQALFAGRTEDPSDPTMGLVREIIHTKNEPPKPSKPIEVPKVTAKPKKEEPKKDHEQLTLDFNF